MDRQNDQRRRRREEEKTKNSSNNSNTSLHTSLHIQENEYKRFASICLF